MAAALVPVLPAVLRVWTPRELLDGPCGIKVRSNGKVWYTTLHRHSGQRYGPFGTGLHRSSMQRRQNRCLHLRVTGSDDSTLHRWHLAGVSNDAPILLRVTIHFLFPCSRAVGAGLRCLNPRRVSGLKGTVHKYTEEALGCTFLLIDEKIEIPLP